MEKDIAELDRLANKHISLELLRKEPALFCTKWFDYRQVHPIQATALFMNSYKEAYRFASKFRIDFEEGEKMSGLKNAYLLDQAKGTLTGLWKARQFCDAHGIPYGFYCNTAMTIAMKNGWEYLPRPSQLYQEELAARILESWEEHVGYSPTLATKALYKASNFAGLYDQIAYQEWLIKLIKRRHHQEYLTRSLLDGDHLTSVYATQHLEPIVLQKASRLCL